MKEDKDISKSTKSQPTIRKPYCLMPWIHFHVGNGGMVRACCVANIPFGNVNKQNMHEIWRGESIQTLRDRFMRGEKDKRCAVCYKLEEAGGKSIRQETFEKFEDINFSDLQREPIADPIYFDIRFSNKCNFRCRTCWHGNSSSWFTEAKKLRRNMGESAIINNINDFEKFIKEYGDAILGSKEIYMAGGEPLVTPEHYFLLEYLIENGATEMKLRYNTNFSVLSYEGKNVMELWKHFKNVEILASIDASGQLGEYIRRGMSWPVILDNRERIRTLDHVKFRIAPTVSVFNIDHLPSLYRDCIKSGMIDPQGLYINILERPYHFNVKALPKEKKLNILKVYEEFFVWMNENNTPFKVRDMFQDCIDYMMAEDKSKFWKQFLAETRE